MNTTTPLNNGQTWLSQVIDMNSDDNLKYNTITVYVLSDANSLLRIMGNNGTGDLVTYAELSIAELIADSLTVSPRFRYNAVELTANGDMTTLELKTTLGLKNLYTSLADVNGTPISSLNPMHVSLSGIGPLEVDITNTVVTVEMSGDVNTNLHDNAGNPLSSTGGALDVNITDSAVIQVTQDKLDHSTDSVTARLQDGTGNALSSTTGSLDVNITNANLTVAQNNIDHSTDSVTARLQDGTGNAISSTTGALDVNMTNAYMASNIQDSTGNALSSTAGSLNVHVTSSVIASVSGMMFSNVGVINADYDNVVLNSEYTSFSGSTYLNKIIAYRASVATTGSDITTNTLDAFNYGLISSGTVAVYAQSSSANDTNSAGTGARQIIIRGIDDTGSNATSVLALSGTSASGFSDTYFTKINDIQVYLSGSLKTNAGKITLYDDVTDTEICNIPVGQATTMLGLLSTSSTRAALLRKCNIQTSTAQTIYFYILGSTNTWVCNHIAYVNGNYECDLKIKLASSSDLRIYGVAATTPGSCSITIDYYMSY